MNNLGCAATARQSNVDTIRSTQTDLLIFVDTSLLFRDIQPIVKYVIRKLNFFSRFINSVSNFFSDLLNSLEFGQVQTDAEYTLFDAREGNVIINTTRIASDLTVNWTQAVHTSCKLLYLIFTLFDECKIFQYQMASVSAMFIQQSDKELRI